MQLAIHTHGVEVSGADRERIGLRLGFALGRFGPRVDRVEVYLSDENGPRGGVDKLCRVVARVRPVGTVVVEDRDGELAPLIDRAADRVGHTVRRRLDRRRAHAGPHLWKGRA